MPLRVVIDDDVANHIREDAEPLVDSVNSVLRRILGLPPRAQAPIFFEIERIGTDESADTSDEVVVGLDTPTRAQREDARPTTRKRRRMKQAGTRKRAPKGSLLDERAYWKPILEVLAASEAGSAPAREVVERVGELLDGRLTPLDREPVSSGGLRWQTRVMFARLRMKDAELLKKDSPRGVWEISAIGRQALDEGRIESMV